MFTARDHDDMQLVHDLAKWIGELLNGLMERHRADPDLNLQTISLLSEAKRDADNADREAGRAERYMAWRQEGKTA